MSIQLFFMDKLIRLTMKRRFRRNPGIMELRAIMDELPPRPAPGHISVESITLGGIRTERLRTSNTDETKAILYIHGGGFVAGVPGNHRPLTWRLAAKVNVPVYVIDYRLPPEHPFPAAMDDCIAAYRGLLEKGVAPKSIIVAGDSAGGNLTLVTALKLKELGLEQPAALICLSPVTDMEGFESRRSNINSDAMFTVDIFPTLAPHYCPGADPHDPFISPWRGDVSGLPPTFIQCSSIEMLRDDSVYMADKMKEAGGDVTLEIWPKVFHVLQVVGDIVP